MDRRRVQDADGMLEKRRKMEKDREILPEKRECQ
jgi:hypothetical protein